MQTAYIVPMPLFDFRCRACGHEFETLVIHSTPPVECPSCHAADPERLLSVFASTSREQRQAAAKKQTQKAAVQAHKDTAAAEREVEHHRREDH